MPPCPPCEPEQDLYVCIIEGNEGLFCFDSLAAAQQSCGVKPGNGVVGDGPTTCDNQIADTDAGWSPTEHVTHVQETGIYEIEQSFFDLVLAHPDQLLYDGARVAWHGNHLEFEMIAPGDLADGLGFQDGDVLVSVNDHELTTTHDVFIAFDALYGSKTFVVHVLRNDKPIVLRYALR